MNIILTSINQDLFDAWTKWCKYDFVEVSKRNIFDTETDAVVLPTNGFGFLDDHIDGTLVPGGHYVEKFGEEIGHRLQKTIKEDYDGELLVGQAVLVPTKNAKIPFIVAAPTMRVPMRLPIDTVNPYLAAKAVILCALRVNEIVKQYKGDPNAREIHTLSFPGLGTGVGGICPDLCAYQVCQAIKDTLVQKTMFPDSWQDSVNKHEQLLKFGE